MARLIFKTMVYFTYVYVLNRNTWSTLNITMPQTARLGFKTMVQFRYYFALSTRLSFKTMVYFKYYIALNCKTWL